MHSADPVELRPSQFSLRAASKGDEQTVYSTALDPENEAIAIPEKL